MEEKTIDDWRSSIGHIQIWYLTILVFQIANEWQDQVTGLGLEIEHRNYSMIDAQTPSPPTWD